MRAFVPFLSLGIASQSFAQSTPETDFVVRCGKLYTGSGTPLDDAWLVVRGGKIQQISRGDSPPDGLRVIDASDKVVMPGIVAADTDLSGHDDDRYTVTPDFVAIDGFDYLRNYKQALSGGVTTVYLAPGRNRLIPGQGSVVKLFGDDIVHRTLSEQNCLRVTLGRESTTNPDVFEPTPHPTADDPLELPRRQWPSSRLSQLATLRMLFREAAAEAPNGLTGPGAAEDRYSAEALRRVQTGEMPLRIAAREAADIRRAVSLAGQYGVRAILENPYDVAPVAASVKRGGASAVVRIPVNISGSNPGGERRNDKRKENRPENAGLLAEAGVNVALAPNRSADLGDYLLVAGIAVRYGLDPEKALAGITHTAAEILGVADRVGSLEPGKHADFLILSGDPLAVGTMVEKTFVDGNLAYERTLDSGLLAIRAGRILTGEGRVIRDGAILVQKGRIKGVGEDLAVPFGARIVSIPNGVVVPGFIDAYTSLGLSGDATEPPAGNAAQRIDEVVRVGDPMFDGALRAGLTTLLVSGSDAVPEPITTSKVAGRITAVKPGARNEEDLVLAPIAGVRFVYDAIDDPTVGVLKSQIDAGRKYIEAWKKYEEALAAWKAGTGEKPEEEEAPDVEPVQEDPVSGSWDVSIEADIPVEIGIQLELKLEGKKVTGTASMSFRENQLPPTPLGDDSSFDGDKIHLTLNMMGGSATLDGTVANDAMSGTFSGGDGRFSGSFTGERIAKNGEGRPAEAGANGEEGDGKPKKPIVNQSLEPIRTWLEGDAPAVIRTNKAPAIKNLIALLEKEKLRYVLHGVGDAIDTPEILGEEPPNVMLGPRLVKRERGKIVNAAATMADIDAPLALVSGDTAGARYLPLHASHAIRYGMDPGAALRALTIGPAKMFGIDDRVGSLKRGKDADFVVFSGSPFELTSRVLLVVADGHIVVDEREEDDR